ncbi:MAG: hypothetical protein PHT84_04590 [Candidatus Pacebacteria bacterium]|nr:hypothetical protein [Candidatus Paceibacterota bacterium]
MKKIIFFVVEWFWGFLFIFILLKYVEINSIKIGSLSFSSLLYSTIAAIILVFLTRIIKKIREKIKEKLLKEGYQENTARTHSYPITFALVFSVVYLESFLLKLTLNFNTPPERIFKSEEFYMFLLFSSIITFLGLVASLLLIKKIQIFPKINGGKDEKKIKGI